MDFIFTVCDNAAGESCPVWPGHPMTAHWGVPDPAAAEGTEASAISPSPRRGALLSARISIFPSLPIATIDRLALKARLDAIGRTDDRIDGNAA